MTNTQDNPPSAEDRGAAIDFLARIASGSAAPLMAGFSQVQQQRSEMLAAGAERLKANLGAQDPLVASLSQQAAAAASTFQTFKAEATRAARIPKVGPNEWLVYGHVTDNNGQPVAGLTVRVFDRDRKYDDLLGETTTDEYGDFAITYHERDFAEFGEAQPDLYLLIQDFSGKQLYSSNEHVRYEAGRVEYYEIALPKAPAPSKPAGKGQARKRKKG